MGTVNRILKMYLLLPKKIIKMNQIFIIISLIDNKRIWGCHQQLSVTSLSLVLSTKGHKNINVLNFVLFRVGTWYSFNFVNLVKSTGNFWKWFEIFIREKQCIGLGWMTNLSLVHDNQLVSQLSRTFDRASVKQHALDYNWLAN